MTNLGVGNDIIAQLDPLGYLVDLRFHYRVHSMDL